MRINPTIATCLGLAALSLTAMAQDQVVLLNVARVQVKPDRIADYMDVEGQYTAAYKKGGGTLRAVYRGAAGNPFEFLVITAMPGYAVLDGASPYAKGSGETQLARMAARRSQCVDAVRVTYERPRGDLGFNTPAAPQPERVIVTRVTVRPDMTDQFAATVKNELVPALKKSGQTSLLARQVEFGGTRNVFAFRSPLVKWSDLDGENPLVRGLGREAAMKLSAKLSSLGNAEWLIYSYVPEMSLRQQQ